MKTVPDLIAYLKANPDKLSYGSSGIGSSQHLGTEFFLTRTGTKMTHVPYRASNEIMNALIGGHIGVALDNITLVLPQVKAGTVRPIGMSTLQPSPSAPEIPTIAATIPDFEASAWHGVFLHSGVPGSIAAKLNADVRAFLGYGRREDQILRGRRGARADEPRRVRRVRRRGTKEVGGGCQSLGSQGGLKGDDRHCLRGAIAGLAWRVR